MDFTLDTNDSFLKERKCSCKITDHLYNAFRGFLRESMELELALRIEYEKGSLKVAEDIIPELSGVNFNPVLNRRVIWELKNLLSRKKTMFVNSNYIFPHDEIVQALRANVQKVENRDFLVVKEEERLGKEEDFLNDGTSYKLMKAIMLNKKFESIYKMRVKSDEKEQRRYRRILEREEKRKTQGQMSLMRRVMDEGEDKSIVSKIIRGPFHYLESKDGIREDDHVSCYEIIKESNEPPLTILLIGKPRCGKTTTARLLAESLGIEHVCVDNFLARLLKKVAEYEPPDDVPEGEEPPKFLSDLEETVLTKLKEGGGPAEEELLEIINFEIARALPRGFVLDLPYFKREEKWIDTFKRGGITFDMHAFSFLVELFYEDADVKLRTKNLRLDLEGGQLFSLWERNERAKPPPKRFK